MNVRAIATACALLAGCGVGRALVGERGEDSAASKCERETCEAVVPAPPVLGDPEPSGVEGCVDAPLPPACDGGPATEPATRGASPVQCGRMLSLDDPLALGTLTCERVVLEQSAQGAAATLRLTDVTWRQLDLTVRSRDPFLLELDRATLDDVRLVLDGPISLRVLSPRELSRLQIRADDSAAKLSILDGRVAGLRAGDPGSEFAGSLAIERAFVRQARIRASRLQIESSDLGDVELEVEQLQLTDCTGQRLALSVGEAQLVASLLSEVNIARCGQLAFYDAILTGVRLPACAMPPTRVYNSTLERSSIEGEIVADHALFSNARLGSFDVTALQLWQTTLTTVTFCAGTERVSLGEKNFAACIFCTEDDGTPVPFTACGNGTDPVALGRACGPLFAPPRCDPELERMRPSAKR